MQDPPSGTAMSAAFPTPQPRGHAQAALLSKRQKAAILIRLLLKEGTALDLDDLPEAMQVDLTHEMGGSVSAEHGVGRLKVEDLERYADPVKLATMRALKDALDPLGILNPGAVLRQQ